MPFLTMEHFTENFKAVLRAKMLMSMTYEIYVEGTTGKRTILLEVTGLPKQFFKISEGTFT